GVERIDLRRPAIHEQVDDALDARREVGRLRRQRAAREACFVGEEARQAEHAEAGADSLKHLAARKRRHGHLSSTAVGTGGSPVPPEGQASRLSLRVQSTYMNSLVPSSA